MTQVGSTSLHHKLAAEYASNLLSEVIGLRNCLKKFMASLGIGNCRVLDTCCVTDCIPTANVDTRIEALKAVTAKDSVHFLSTGYDHFVKHIIHALAKPNITPLGKSATATAKMHYWRGFRSPVGVTANANNSRASVHGCGAHAWARPHRSMQHHNPITPLQKALTN